jgi:predicted RNase H-like nuclease (RuvC/YqgF family)
VENVREDVVGLEERVVSGIEQHRQAHEDLAALVTHLDAQTDQQFSQVGNRLGQLETTTGQQQNETQKQVERVGQLEKELSTQIGQLTAQLTGLQASWQEQATTAENEACQLRRALDAQGRLLQTLQKQIDEERRVREALGHQVAAMLKKREEGQK